ncbi:TolC family protein [Deminuibacter soli]|uniref:TolC family protein n=1 Tax=Deminuibacter soli TaxID=2291815 RepID=A0A3E1NRU6_9BACT|nr:TolC family protein [Deminuibacter soli]RFM30643.1 TolC family protein [Deminuibacter soli]
MKRIVFFCLAIGPLAAAAQNLTLHDAINIALKNSLDIQVVQNNLKANTINNDYGVAGGLPQVGVNLANTEQNTAVKQKLNTGEIIERTGTYSNNLSGGLSAGMVLYNGMHIVATKHRLEQLQLLSEQSVDSMIINVEANVMLKYYDVIRQQSYARTLQRSIDVSQQKLSIIKAQKEVGMANNADLFQAQVDLNTQQQALQSQQLVIDQGKTDLLTLLTLRPDSLITINDTILVDKQVSLDSVLNNMYARNPRLLNADVQIRINELREKEIASQMYPLLSANAGYNYSRTKNGAGNVLFNQNYGPYIGATLSIPIFNGNIYRKQTKVAEINTANAKLQKSMAIRDYTSTTVKSWQAYNNNLQQLETAKGTYALSGQLLELVLQRFQLRQATIVDVITAQQSFENAGYSLINLTYAAKASEIQLKLLANLLTY